MSTLKLLLWTYKKVSIRRNKEVTIVDLTSATHGSNQRYLHTKTSNYLKTDGTRVMTGYMNINFRGIIDVKQAQAHERTHAANIHIVNTSKNINNTLTSTNYQMYVNDRLNQSVDSADLKNTLVCIMNKERFFSDKDLHSSQ